MTILTIVGFLLLIGLLFWWLLKKDAKRTAAFKLFANSRELTFVEAVDPSTIQEKFGSLPVFSKGNSHAVSNVLKGHVGDFEIWICDYIFWDEVKQIHADSETHVSSSQKQRQTLLCLLFNQINVPAFDISLKVGMGNLSAYSKKDVIEFEGNSVFSKIYNVCAAPTSDKSIIKSMITDELTAIFSSHHRLKLEVGGSKMALTNYSTHIKPSELEGYIKIILRIGNSLR
ncbi:MAG: hypothetical protein ABJG78_08380 [Cyclobacteriaceae bacterium]